MQLLPVMVAAIACACSGDRADQGGGPAGVSSIPADPVPPSLASQDAAAVHMTDAVISLPEAVGAWKRPAVPRTVTARDIFDYMDGAGELYLAYRFDHLDIYDYTSAAQGNILVELYWMKLSDDAFGLLSHDWGGEDAVLTPAWARAQAGASVSPHRALYGAGLLRIWSDRLYVRVLASRETAPSRQAVYDIGRAVVSGQAVPAPPALLAALPLKAGARFRLRSDRVWFLRSYLVLNSAYFLATENILNLDASTEAAVAPYDSVPPTPGRKPIQLILVRYATAGDARKALTHFRDVYLPESVKGTATSGLEATALARIEDGWVAYRLSGRALALALECPDREQAHILIDEAVRNLENLEVSQDG
jgi:hypothetical protein